MPAGQHFECIIDAAGLHARKEIPADARIFLQGILIAADVPDVQRQISLIYRQGIPGDACIIGVQLIAVCARQHGIEPGGIVAVFKVRCGKTAHMAVLRLSYTHATKSKINKDVTNRHYFLFF